MTVQKGPDERGGYANSSCNRGGAARAAGNGIGGRARSTGSGNSDAGGEGHVLAGADT